LLTALTLLRFHCCAQKHKKELASQGSNSSDDE